MSIPALTLLTNLGYQFIPPIKYVIKRCDLPTVILPNELRDAMQHKTHTFMEKAYPWSVSTVDKNKQG